MGAVKSLPPCVDHCMCLHVFLTGEPLRTALALERFESRVSEQMSLQIPSTTKLLSTYLAIQTTRLFM